MIRISKVKYIVWKDIKDMVQSKYVLFSVLLMPIVFGAFLPLSSIFPLLGEDSNDSSGSDELDLGIKFTDNWDELNEIQKTVIILIELYNLFLILIPIILPTVLASDSFVGEKDRKTVVNILATPLSDEEIYLGKVLSTFLPTVLGLILAFSLYFGMVSYVTQQVLGTLYLLNINFFTQVFILGPLLGLGAINLMIWVSTRTSTTRDAQQLGSFITLVFMPLIGIFSFALFFNRALVFVFLVAIVVVDILLVRFGMSLLNREKWYSSV